MSIVKLGEFMRQRLKQGPSLFHGFFAWKPGGYPFHKLNYSVSDHCTGKSSDMWQKGPFGLLHRRIDADLRLFSVICRDFERDIDGFLHLPKKGEFLSQSLFRANLCVWKISIDSSIQA